MRVMTLEELLMKEDDNVILDIYTELESCVVPATGYAHAYCRKVNKLINAGELCTVRDKYRNVYLPTLSKMIFKEMARRYAMYCHNCKTVEPAPAVIEASEVEIDGVDGIDEPRVCVWCGEVFDRSEVKMTDLGLLCDHCIEGIRSRGEVVAVYE